MHATESTLLRYPSLLTTLRSMDGLSEQRPGRFYRKAEAFLHFHEDSSGLYCDLRTDSDGEFVRMHVESSTQQAQLLELVTRALLTPVRR